MVEGWMRGKRGLVMGVANDRSIAWGVAGTCAEAGADLAFAYQNDILEKRVRPLAEGVGSDTILPCDVANDGDVDRLFDALERDGRPLDFVVHSIAFAPKRALSGRYADTSAKDFQTALNVSCYSFTAVAQRAERLMTNGGSLLTISYYGAEKAIPNYNVMGVAKAALEASVRYLAADLGPKNVRVNALSAGSVRTLASSGIADFRTMWEAARGIAPLRRNVTTRDVGTAALYLLSDLSAGVTGEIHHVDAGYNVIGAVPTPTS